MPVTPAQAEATLFEGLRKLRSEWPSRGWSWDSRLACVVSSFSADHEKVARAAIAQGLPTIWTNANIGQAPQRVREIATKYGEVRSGQMLLTGGAPEAMLAFGLWWPWGTSETISMRVGLAGIEPERSAHGRFRDIFGVTM